MSITQTTFFCGTILLGVIMTLMVVYKISEKWRLDNYKLKIEKIKQNIAELKDLSTNLKMVKKLLEGLTINGNNNIISNK